MYVRINEVDPGNADMDWRLDLEAVIHPNLYGIVIPKVSDPKCLQTLHNIVRIQSNVSRGVICFHSLILVRPFRGYQ